MIWIMLIDYPDHRRDFAIGSKIVVLVVLQIALDTW
jgi:hypothetical protein